MDAPRYADEIKNAPVAAIAILLPLLLPFSVKYSAWVVWAMVGAWLFAVFAGKVSPFNQWWKPVLVMGSPAIILASTLLYSSNPKEGWSLVERSAMFLIIPLTLFSLKSLEQKWGDRILISLVVAVTVVMVYCLGVAFNNFLTMDPALAQNGDAFHQSESAWNFFTYLQLLSAIPIHPTYFSMYLSLAVLFLIDQWMNHAKGKWRTGIAWLIVFMIIFVILASARMAIISLFISLAYLLLVGIRVKRAYSLGALLTFIAGFAIFSFTNTTFRNRLNDLTTLRYPETATGWNAVNLRLAIWSCSTEIFSDSWLLGVGAGDHADARIACYKQYSFYETHGSDFHSHNQFLEYGVVGGVMLLAVFISALGFSFFHATRRRDYLYVSFLICFVLNCMTESLLTQFKGVVFYAFFNAVLFASSARRTNA